MEIIPALQLKDAGRLLLSRLLLHHAYIFLRHQCDLQAHIGLVDGTDVLQLVSQSLYDIGTIPLKERDQLLILPSAL